MKPGLLIFLIIIILIAVLVHVYITLYNKLVFSKIRTEEADKLILDELQNRYDLIMSLKNTIEKNTKMDLTIFKDLEDAKAKNISSYELEKKLTNAIDVIYLLKNDYPKLEEKKDFKTTLTKLEESDTKIDAAKSFYNKHNQTLVTLLKKFPTNLIGIIHKIKIKQYYEGKEIFNEDDDGIKI